MTTETITDQPLPPAGELQLLLDENDIRRQITRFASYLDQKRWQDYANLYAPDAVLDLPHGRAEGRETIAQWVASDLGRYEATHHAGGLQDISIDGDTATVFATLLATHVTSTDGREHWTGGGWYEMTLRRERGEWLFTAVRPRPVWFSGAGPQARMD